MRTSTAFFLVVFLVLASSDERRERLRETASRLAHRAGAILSPREDARASAPPAGLDGAEREQVRALERRIDSAERARRALDRSMRMLDDRLRQVGGGDELAASTASLLRRQREELREERTSLERVVLRLRAEIVAIRTRAELDAAREERSRAQALVGLAGETVATPLEALGR